MELLIRAVILTGIISLVYYGIVIYYAGLKASFAWIWLLFGFGCLLFAGVVRFLVVNDRMPGRNIQLIFIIAVAAGGGGFLIMEGILLSHARRKADQGMDYIIILGAQVKGTMITKCLRKRLETAVIYLKDNPETKAIVSGGQGTGEQITEADAMADYLQSAGIGPERIFCEDKSTNTEENIRFSRAFIKDENTKVAIVTNGFHIYRAMLLARKLGFEHIQGISAPSDPLLSVNYYVRELFGLVKDLVCGNLT